MPAHVHVYLNAEESTVYEFDATDENPLANIIITGHAGMVVHPVTPLETDGVPIAIRFLSLGQPVDIVPESARAPFEAPKENKTAPKAETHDAKR